MIKLFKIVSLFILTILLFGCSENNSDLLQKMEKIKKIGDDNPRLALNMLDSLTIQVRNESAEYTQMKYDLLKIRLSDKADIKPTSDFIIIPLLNYFVKNGNNLEKQEAYYYAGSIYRDLNDTPRALEYYHKSEDLAEKALECDSILLRNTYSQLHLLLFNIQDYQRALFYAKLEYEITKRTEPTDPISLNHIGISYLYIDSLKEAKRWLKKELDVIENYSDLDFYSDNIYSMLYNFSYLHDYDDANKCFDLAKKLKGNGTFADKYIALGEYYAMTGDIDSAIINFKHKLDNAENCFNVYDMSKALFRLYLDKGDLNKASRYALLHANACDTLDLGKRQELAATVNNQFQYHYDKEKEQKMKEEKERLHYIIIIISVAAVLGLSLFGLLLIYRKNRNLKKMLKLSKELDDMKTSQEMLMEKISQKEEELNCTEQSYNNAKEELKAVNEKLKDVTDEVEEQKKELKAKETELAERLKQNNTYMKLLHQSELEDKAQEIVESIKQTSEGLKQMSATDWKQLIQAVDELYPDFHGQVKKRVKRLTEQRMQVCYLMKIGLDKKQIQNMVNISRSTSFRWHDKEFMWIIEENEK